MMPTRNIYGLRKQAIATCLVFLAVSCFQPVRAETGGGDVATIVSRVVAAYGGEEALNAMRSFRQTGETVSLMGGGAKGRITRVFEAPDRLRVEIDYPGKAPEVRILNGEHGWNQGREAPDSLRDAMRLQAARLDLPLLLLGAGAAVKDLGIAPAEDGRAIKTLGLALADHLAIFVDIEVPGYRIVQSRGQMRQGGIAMEFSAVYSGFREWSGVLLPAREEQYAMGQHIGYTVIEQIEALPDPDPAAFQP